MIIVAGLTVIPIAVALWRYNTGRAGEAGSLAAGDNRGDRIEPHEFDRPSLPRSLLLRRLALQAAVSFSHTSSPRDARCASRYAQHRAFLDAHKGVRTTPTPAGSRISLREIEA